MLVGAVWTIIILSILLFIITVMQCISLFHIFLVWGRHISHATPFVSVARITSSPTAIYGACAALAHLQRHARRLRRLIFLLEFFERHAKIAQRHGPYWPQSCRKIHLGGRNRKNVSLTFLLFETVISRKVPHQSLDHISPLPFCSVSKLPHKWKYF